MKEKNLVVILGPTAVGKTSVAISIAKVLNTEILSADSRQFFRELNIGTAKPSEEELLSVKHHFINSLSIQDEYNVGKFEKEALETLEIIFNGKNTVIMAGGSGLYIDALCNGFDELPQADNDIRKKINTLYKERGIEGLREKLKTLDEVHYKKIDLHNPHRLIRAIEVCMVTGKPYSSLRKKDNSTDSSIKRPFNIIKIGLNTDRKKLYERINQRVDKMMDQGLLSEVKSLVKFKNKNALLTVGYKELFDYLDGKTDLSRAIELIKQNTRNFAKRQLTWFRKDPAIKWFGPDEEEKIIRYLKEKLHTVKQ